MVISVLDPSCDSEVFVSNVVFSYIDFCCHILASFGLYLSNGGLSRSFQKIRYVFDTIFTIILSQMLY